MLDHPTIAGRVEAFNLGGVAYVGDLSLEETLAVVHQVDAPDDCVVVDGGNIYHVDNVPTGGVCPLTFEAVRERFEGRCTICDRPSVMHRAERKVPVLA